MSVIDKIFKEVGAQGQERIRKESCSPHCHPKSWGRVTLEGLSQS